jgi:hypothetical protein
VPANAMRRRAFAALAIAMVMAMASSAWAQSTGTIAGAVKDTSGAVMPGVSVEAASPALIERVRSAVTDSQGQYKIVDLQPGVYTVTFTLAGFNTVKREGIELTASFTAVVNSELRVGSLQETITVSGQTPLVDTQNVTERKSLTSDIIDGLPTARTFQSLSVLVPGVSAFAVSGGSGQDVGGSVGESWTTMSIHGSSLLAMPLLFDGMSYTHLSETGGGYRTEFVINSGAVQEMSVTVGGKSAESDVSGVTVNSIPKSGSNVFSGSLFANYTNNDLQTDNLTSDLRARGLTNVNKQLKVWDFNPTFGGPIAKDRLWFFSAYRHWGEKNTVAGMYYNLNPTGFNYVPDLTRPADFDQWNWSALGRLTWQASSRNKVNIHYDRQQRASNPAGSATVSPEAGTSHINDPQYLTQVTWNSPVSNRFLLEAGATIYRTDWYAQPAAPTPDGIYSTLDLSRNLTIRAPTTTYNTFHAQQNIRFSATYVTGSHAFKVGLSDMWGHRNWIADTPGEIQLRLLGGVPSAIQEFIRPLPDYEALRAKLALYAQDQWTISRLTLNLGLRFDYHNAYVPAQNLAAVKFSPARTYNAMYDVPNWKDISPRIGASWDLFGTGKTAVKASISRYLAADATGFASRNNPVNTSVNAAIRTWTDNNNNFVPDCDLSNSGINGECGALSATNFGRPNIVTRYADEVIHGFGNRGWDWEFSTAVQQEVRPGVAAELTYVRHWFGNFIVVENQALSPTDFGSYCITAPLDPRLPGGGGNQLCGIYDINPDKFGQVANLVQPAANFGKQTDVYDGIDLSINARFPRGVLVSGGFNVGHEVTDNCYLSNLPNVSNQSGNAVPQIPGVLTQAARPGFCRVAPPFQAQVKAFINYPLPWWGIRASATYQSLPGPEITASLVASNSEIAPSLGRNLSAGATATATIDLIPFGSVFADRINQVDFRVTKSARVGRVRLEPMLDVFNLFNASPILGVNTRYGTSWLTPTQILPGRLFKLGVQLNF